MYSNEENEAGQKPFDSLFKSRVESFESKRLSDELTIIYSLQYGSNKRKSAYAPQGQPAPFNFSKVPDEVNLVTWMNDESSESPPGSPPSFHLLKSLNQLPEASSQSAPSYSVLKVNMSPFFHSHSLYVPHLQDIRRQKISSAEQIEDVLSLFCPEMKPMMPSADRLWVGFNSKGAQSSVDHQHFQVILVSELL